MASLSESFDRSSILVTQPLGSDDSCQRKKPNLVYSTFATMVLGFAITASNIATEASLNEHPFFYLNEQPELYTPRAIAVNKKSSVFIKRHHDASIDSKVYAFKTFGLKRYRQDADEINKEIIREYLPWLIPTLRDSKYVARTLGAHISPIINTDVIRVEILMEGARMSLADLQESRRTHQNDDVLDLTTKIQLCGDVCRGLHAVHYAGLAHGDLKTENILIFESADPCRAFHAKLADFGLAPLVDGTEEDAVDIIGGTWPWQAPELQPGYHPARPFSLIDVRMMDYYSLGLLCWRVYIDGIWPYKHHHVKKALKEFAADPDSAVWLMKKNQSATKLAIKESIDCENSPEGAGVLGIRAAEILSAVVPRSRNFRIACRILMVYDLPDIPIQKSRCVVAKQIERMMKTNTFGSFMPSTIFRFTRLQLETYRSIVAEASQADITAGSFADVLVKYFALTFEIKWIINPAISTQESTSDLFEKFKVAIALEIQNQFPPQVLNYLCRIQKYIWPNIAGQDLDLLKLAIHRWLPELASVDLMKGQYTSILECSIRLGMYTSLGECQKVLRRYDRQRFATARSSDVPYLLWATTFGSFADLRRLLQNEGFNLDETDLMGNTSLHWACYIGDYDKAIMLLEHGARTDIRNTCQNYPIHQLGWFETSQGRLDSLVKALSVNLDQTLLFGSAVSINNPLFPAAFLKINLPATKALLKLHKPNPDQVEEFQILAAAGHLPEFLELFLDLEPAGPLNHKRERRLIKAIFRTSLARKALSTDSEAGDALKRTIQLILSRSETYSRGDTQELIALILSHLIAGHDQDLFTYFCAKASLDCLNTPICVTSAHTPNGINWKATLLPPIHHAIIANNWDSFEHLLQRGADLQTLVQGPSMPDEGMSWGPLSTLVRANHISSQDCCRFAKRILCHYQEKGISLNETDREAFTRSFYLVGPKFASTLLQFPSFFDIDMTDPKRGFTALGWAVIAGSPAAVKEILKYKPNVVFSPDTGMTALTMAATLHRAGHCDTPVGGCLRTPEIVEEITTVLLDYFNPDQIGFTVEIRGQIVTALHLACSALNLFFLKVFIRHPRSRSLLNSEATVGGMRVTALDLLDAYQSPDRGAWSILSSYNESVLERDATPCERAQRIQTQMNMVAMLESEGCRRNLPAMLDDSADEDDDDEMTRLAKMMLEMIMTP